MIETVDERLCSGEYTGQFFLGLHFLILHGLRKATRVTPLLRVLVPELVIEHGFGIEGLEIDLESLIDNVLNPRRIVLDTVRTYIGLLLLSVAMSRAKVEVALRCRVLVRYARPVYAILDLLLLLLALKRPIELRIGCSVDEIYTNNDVNTDGKQLTSWGPSPH